MLPLKALKSGGTKSVMAKREKHYIDITSVISAGFCCTTAWPYNGSYLLINERDLLWENRIFCSPLKQRFSICCVRHALPQCKASFQVHLFAKLDLKGVNSSIIMAFYKQTQGIYHNFHLYFCRNHVCGCARWRFVLAGI